MEESYLGQMNVRRNYINFIMNDLEKSLIEKRSNTDIENIVNSISRNLSILKSNSSKEHYEILKPLESITTKKIYTGNIAQGLSACRMYLRENTYNL